MRFEKFWHHLNMWNGSCCLLPSYSWMRSFWNLSQVGTLTLKQNKKIYLNTEMENIPQKLYFEMTHGKVHKEGTYQETNEFRRIKVLLHTRCKYFLLKRLSLMQLVVNAQLDLQSCLMKSQVERSWKRTLYTKTCVLIFWDNCLLNITLTRLPASTLSFFVVPFLVFSCIFGTLLCPLFLQIILLFLSRIIVVMFLTLGHFIVFTVSKGSFSSFRIVSEDIFWDFLILSSLPLWFLVTFFQNLFGPFYRLFIIWSQSFSSLSYLAEDILMSLWNIIFVARMHSSPIFCHLVSFSSVHFSSLLPSVFMKIKEKWMAGWMEISPDWKCKCVLI